MKDALFVGYIDPSLPCPPAKRARDSDLLDLPPTMSGARPHRNAPSHRGLRRA